MLEVRPVRLALLVLACTVVPAPWLKPLAPYSTSKAVTPAGAVQVTVAVVVVMLLTLTPLTGWQLSVVKV